jgi:hypothetical protein
LKALSKIAIALIAIVGATSAWAEETVETTDGRKIILRDDGTFKVLEKKMVSSSSGGTISLNDLKLDIAQMTGKPVSVRGNLSIVGDLAMLGTEGELFDSTPVNVDLKKLPREQRKAILEDCSKGCTANITGKVGKLVFGLGIVAQSVTID